MVLVTGANGFVGSNLVAGLLGRGYRVRALVRHHSDTSALDGLACDVTRADYHRPEQLIAPCLGTETVYHVAARASDWGRREAFRDANLGVTRNVARAAERARVRRLVFISSAVIYGCEALHDASEDMRARNYKFPYAETKRQCEDSLLGMRKVECGERNPEIVIVRPGDVVGPGDRLVTAPVIRTIRRGLIPLVGTGRAIMCYTYVANLVQGIILAGEKGRPGQAYNISDGRDVTFREYFDRIAAVLGGIRFHVPVPYAIAHSAGIVLEAVYGLLDISRPPPITRYRALRGSRDCHISIEKARRELGYHPDLDLDTQVKAQVDWFLRMSA